MPQYPWAKTDLHQSPASKIMLSRVLRPHNQFFYSMYSPSALNTFASSLTFSTTSYVRQWGVIFFHVPPLLWDKFAFPRQPRCICVSLHELRVGLAWLVPHKLYVNALLISCCCLVLTGNLSQRLNAYPSPPLAWLQIVLYLEKAVFPSDWAVKRPHGTTQTKINIFSGVTLRLFIYNDILLEWTIS